MSFSLSFWDGVKKRYKVDMSSLKPYAIECMTRGVRIQTVPGENVLAHAALVCRLSLATVAAENLQGIAVNVGSVWFEID